MRFIELGTVLWLAVISIFMVSCAGTPSPGGYKLSMSPSALKVGENALNLLVTDDQGLPVTDLTVSFDVAHRTMEMAKQVVAASHKGEGNYQGMITIAHSGSWVILVDLVKGGQRLGRYEFGYDVGP